MKNKSIIFYIIGGVIGGTAGFLYWKFIGCINGCTIWSSWWKSTGAGGLLGSLAGGIVFDFIQASHKKKSNTHNPDI